MIIFRGRDLEMGLCNRTNKLLFALATLCICLSAQAGNGGPDQYGYSWRDSNEPDLDFNWVEIRNLPDAEQVMDMQDDNFIGMFDLEFDFHYYWADYSQLRIGSNGWVSFDNGFEDNSWCFQRLPTTSSQSTDNTLAPFLVDLTFLTNYPSFPNPAECWFWTNKADSTVISFYDVPWWKDDSSGLAPPDWAGPNTFQIVLDASDSSITFQYLEMAQQDFVDRSACASEVVVGIENLNGQIGLEVFLEQVPPDSFAIKFVPPALDTFEVRDPRVSWNQNPENRGRFVIVGDSIWLNTEIANVGNVLVDSAVHVNGIVKTISQTPLWTESDTLDSLAAGLPQLISFQTTAILSNPGQHYFDVSVDAIGDLNQANNSQSTEISAIVDTSANFTLSYVIGAGTSTSLSWPPGIGGNNGGGIFIDFPYHPHFRVNSIEVFIVGNDGNPNTPLPAGFRMEIWKPDSVGAADSLLESVVVAAAQGLEDAWNTVILPNSPVIYDGRFYVAWIQGGPGIGLGTEIAGPKSRQTYEILNGIWAPYRFRNQQDFLIKANIERVLVNAENEALSAEFEGLKLVPNPTEGNTTLHYFQPRKAELKIMVHDILGRVALETTAISRSPGHHRQELNLSELNPGIYFISLQGSSQTQTVKLLHR